MKLKLNYYVIQEKEATNPLAGPKFYAFNFDTVDGVQVSLTDFTTATQWIEGSDVKGYAAKYLSNYKILKVQIEEV